MGDDTFEYRGQRTAGRAPIGPEIDQYRHAMRSLDHIAVEMLEVGFENQPGTMVVVGVDHEDCCPMCECAYFASTTKLSGDGVLVHRAAHAFSGIIPALPPNPAPDVNPHLAQLQPYPFEKLRALFSGVTPNPQYREIKLSIGEPQHATPAFIRDALATAFRVWPSPDLRSAFRRFVRPSPAGVASLRIWRCTRHRDLAGKRLARGAVRVRPEGRRPRSRGHAAGGQPQSVLPDLRRRRLLAGATPPSSTRCRTTTIAQFRADCRRRMATRAIGLRLLAGQSDRQGAVAGGMETLFALSDRYGFVIASDECYSEIYFDEADPPIGVLQAATASAARIAARHVLQSVQALQRARPALRFRRRRRGYPEEVPALPHLSRLRHGAAGAYRLGRRLERRDPCARRPPPVPREIRCRHAAGRRSARHRPAGRRFLPVGAHADHRHRVRPRSARTL